MTIYTSGALNLASLIVPDLAVVVVPPDVSQINGVPTNVVGVVGSADWGAKNAPVAVGSMSDYVRKFGLLRARKYDMGTAIAAAVLQGANNFRCVRVTDGTDVAATILVQTDCIAFTSKYTGSRANADQVRVEPGSKTGTFRVTVLRPGQAPEMFDNIGLGLTANPLWVAIANAINLGQSGLRGPSELIVATAGAGVTAPATATYTLAGGVDGAAGVDKDDLIGVDTAGARTGMYALRGAGASIGMIADLDDSTTWTTQVAFGLAEGVYFQAVAPAGSAIANGTTGTVDLKATAGIDSFAIKILHGDWCLFNDTVNGQTRLISPQGFAAGRLASLSPENSGLNKQIFGIVGTQRSAANQRYSFAELQQLGSAGIDVITNPVPGGAYFGLRFGRNAFSAPENHSDAYTRMTNFIAATFNAGLGIFVGRNQSIQPGDPLRREAKATLDAFMDTLLFARMIDDYQNRVDDTNVPGTNNPANRVALGIMQADVQVRYLGVVEHFIVNLQAGQGVTVNRLQLAA